MSILFLDNLLTLSIEDYSKLVNNNITIKSRSNKIILNNRPDKIVLKKRKSNINLIPSYRT